MRRDLNIDERAAVAAALWLVIRDPNVRAAFQQLAFENRDPQDVMLANAISAYNAIVGVPAT